MKPKRWSIYLSDNLDAGSIIRGTGGVRKLRWAIEGRGKSGGVRVICYYHNETVPLALITVYAKSRKDDLTGDER